MRAIVVIPTYNERENIERLIKEVLSISPILDILVVDDNSPDGTGEIVEKISKEEPRVKVMRRPAKMGLGSAYVDGFKYALQGNYDFIIQMDADFSHSPQDISRFLDLIQHYDVVIGSRYTDGVSVVNWPITRLLLSYIANLYARIVTGVPIKDLTGGFKCFKRKVLESIKLDKIVSDGYAFQIEMNVLAWRRGFKMVEIPIIFVERRAGSSKMSKKIIWEAFWLVWRLRIDSIFKRR
jgi:dolichol-phosphate mannosyltransferase